ncbi:hypothetical protein [Streptomyces cellostaticus]|nr:hypothetical protein [Streptomyces cellostaticus]GHI08134.1 hypothetical protein Scel_64550 [Streptomyces cellostaticus]
MSADRNGNHDMSQTDIAFLLADAADEVEIGAAPVQAVIRGGRRRRARRWAVASATALVVAGTTGALAVTGLPGGGHADRQANVANPPASPEARHVYEPQETELSRGMFKGKPWYVDMQVWGAPRNEDEAARQYDAMAARGIEPVDDKPAALIGKTSYFVTRKYGSQRPRQFLFDSRQKLERLSGRDLQFATNPLDDTSDPHGDRVAVGAVAKTAREVTCFWKDGTTTLVKRGPVVYEHNLPKPAIVPVAGYPTANWFVCVAPERTGAKTAEVTK